MISLTEFPDRLEITLLDKTEFLSEFPDLNPSVGDVLEISKYLGNNWFDLTGLIGLTDSPIIGYDIQINDNGEIMEDGNIYWFPDYMVINPWEQLINNGVIYFEKG